ncbi:DUF1223 domain-containing protein [Brevundimonas sp. GCM10030266]|uniref:DUF1223 domain-containing protein n=1 Tax=Brevundimonas sp. GCM10030266 TaxID=3273386 RepID=UPI00360AA97A
MRTWGWTFSIAVGLTALLTAASSAQPSATRVRHRAVPAEPVVVELFTAQGCSGCPEANARIETVAAEPGVIALTYAVDYWDYLGWADTFARPEFAQRQRDYRRALQIRNVSTPQVVIDGRRQAPASIEAIQVAIDEEAARRVFPPEVEFRETGDRVGVGSGRAPVGGAEVVAVVYTPGPQTVEISGGDNRGQKVRHVNVVRSVRVLGPWTGRPVLYALPEQAGSDQAVAVLVQARDDRRILTAAVLDAR